MAKKAEFLGHRKFYDFEFIDENIRNVLLSTGNFVSDDVANLIKYIGSNVIGRDYAFQSPFGVRKGKKKVSSSKKIIIII